MGARRQERSARDGVGRHHDGLSNADCVALLSLAMAGDAAAENLVFAHLRRRMVPLARQALRTPDVEDVVQDVLVVVHSKYRALVASCQVEDGAGFERWWRRILYYRIGNDIRRRRFECGRCVSADCLSTLAGLDASDARCRTSELRALLLKALQHLKGSQRSCVASAVPRHAGDAESRRDARYAKLYRARKALRQVMRQAGFSFLAAACILARLS